MDAEPIRASYVLTEEDLLVGFREGSREELRRRRRMLHGTAAAIAAVFVVNGLVNGVWSVFIGLLAVGTVALARLLPAIAERQVRAKTGVMREVGRRVTLTLSEDRLRTDIEGLGDSSFAPDALDGVEAREGGLLLRPAPEQSLWVPDRAFASPDDRRRFLDRLRATRPLPAASL